MNVGITGHKGFIGSVVFDTFDSDDRFSSVEGFSHPENDLLDDKALQSFVKDKDVIVHLAALNRAEDSDLWEVNTLGTLKLLLALKDYGKPGARIVFASSFQVYRPTFAEEIISESFSLEPNILYGLSKKVGEELIRFYSENFVILRMSNTYGPGGRPFYNSVIATFAHLIKENKPLTIFGDGSQSRDFVFVDDVADAFLKAALSKDVGEFNICTGESVSLNEVIDTISRITKMPVKKVFKPLVVKEIRQRGSYEKAKNAFGWKPSHTFIEGMKKVLGV